MSRDITPEEASLFFRARMLTGSELFDYDEPNLTVELPISVVREIGEHPFQEHHPYDTNRAIWIACRRALLIDKGGE